MNRPYDPAKDPWRVKKRTPRRVRNGLKVQDGKRVWTGVEVRHLERRRKNAIYVRKHGLNNPRYRFRGGRDWLR